MPPRDASKPAGFALLAAVCLACPASASEPRALNNSWYRHDDSPTVMVFVHGILSNSQDAWTAHTGAFWPELVANDARFGKLSIYLGGYHTSFDSGPYTIPQAADELLVHLRVGDARYPDPPLDRGRIVFVAHSTGGLVVRYLLEVHRELFADKAVGLVLLASPSRGSAWSNRLRWLNRYYGNRMAGDLELWNPWILDLDRRFAVLVQDRKLPHLAGVDLFESRFVVPGGLFRNTYVVSPEDTATYFGGAAIIADTDHFSIAKPESVDAEVYKRVLDFYRDRFVPLAEALEPKVFVSAYTAADADLPWEEVKAKFLGELPMAVSNSAPEVRAAARDRLVEHYIDVRRRVWRMHTVPADRMETVTVGRPGETRAKSFSVTCPKHRIVVPGSARVAGAGDCALEDGPSGPSVRITQAGKGTAVCTLTAACAYTDAFVEKRVAREREDLRALAR